LASSTVKDVMTPSTFNISLSNSFADSSSLVVQALHSTTVHVHTVPQHACDYIIFESTDTTGSLD
jgi:hypothetical protein